MSLATSSATSQSPTPSTSGVPASPGASVSGVPVRLHNVVSYAGALVTFPLVIALRAAVAGAQVGALSWLAWGLWSAHFLRRTLESAYVHRYGPRNVSWADALQEYAYYWGFAVWIAWASTRPGHGLSELAALGGVPLFLVGELGNFKAHQLLRGLRPEGTQARPIPRGFLFELVSCPHYFFEVVSWLGFALATGLLGSWAFFALGAAILAGWARARHQAYLKAFDGQQGRELYPAHRKAILPFVY